VSSDSIGIGFHGTARIVSKLSSAVPYIFPYPNTWENILNRTSKGDVLEFVNRSWAVKKPCTLMLAKQKVNVSSFDDVFWIECVKDIEQCVRQRKKSEKLLTQNLNKRIRQSIKESQCTPKQRSKIVKSSSNTNKGAAALLKERLLGKKEPTGNTVGDGDNDCDEVHSEQSVYFSHLRDVPAICFLGTGSAEPSKYRGPSAIYIEFNSADQNRGLDGILLDCGEGTFGQFVRLYGFDTAMKKINKLKLVWISHRHADHMSGIVEILCRRSHKEPPLVIAGPKASICWITHVSKLLPLSPFTLEYLGKNLSPNGSLHPIIHHMLGVKASFTKVRHCYDSYAISLVLPNGFKLVYSGDTEPCKALIEDGKGADLLIHEATFEPEMVRDARAKRHSTSSEAMEVAKEMGARHTILTHFSQRYPKFPKGIEFDSSISCTVAFDGMCVPLTALNEFESITALMLDAVGSDEEIHEK